MVIERNVLAAQEHRPGGLTGVLDRFGGSGAEVVGQSALQPAAVASIESRDLVLARDCESRSSANWIR